MTPIVWITRLLVGAYPQWHGSAPTRKQRIYLANHTSHLDTTVIWSALPGALRSTTRPVAAKDYWTKGLIRRRRAMKELNVVVVDRRRAEHATPLEPLKGACGLWHLMRAFPDVELIPVYIENLHRALPKGTYIPVPTVCSVHFGAPLAHSASDPKAEFLERARQAVIDLAKVAL